MTGKKASSEYSCTVCTQRKVRCDKAKPCSNCVKAGIQCEVIPPPPPRRRKRKLDERELSRKLVKYEQLMEKNGIDFRSSVEDTSNADYEEHTEETTEPIGSEHDSTTQRSRGHPTQYHKEFEQASDLLFGHTSKADRTQAPFHRAFDAVFDGSNSFPFLIGPSTNMELGQMHPNGMQIMQLFQVYLDNVDPLLKLTHTPSLQKRILEASGRIASGKSKLDDEGLESLMFNIYFIAVNSLTDDTLMSIFGSPKSRLQDAYYAASQQALVNAGLMRTVDITVLQAYALHLVAIRTFIDPRTHYALIGIAIRIASRLGLHRDGAQIGLSSFEVEQRRRLWWNLVTLDKRVAETTGSTVTAMSTPHANCGRPLNINDTDLHVNAKSMPQPSSTTTEMVFCLARYELATAATPDPIKPLPSLPTHDRPGQIHHRRPWETETSDQLIQSTGNDLEDYWRYVEATFLQRLDVSIPIHQFTLMMTHQNLRKLRLIANIPKAVGKHAEYSSDLRQWAFDESLRLLEDDNSMQSTTSFNDWLWYTHMHFPFPAYMFLVRELKLTCTGELCARAWEAMDRNHKLRGLMGPGKKGSPMHVAFGKLFIEAWDAREKAEAESGRFPTTPELVEMIREILGYRQQQEHQSVQSSVATASPNTTTQQSQMQQQWYGSGGTIEWDLLASIDDVNGMEYIIPSLI